MSANEKQLSDQVMRTFAMLELLAGEVPSGMRNKDIAQALDVNPTYVTRSFELLEAKGWAEKTEDGRMRITSRFSQLSFRVLRGYEKAAGQLDDMKRNYTLG
jgi:DNA-binding IclR family transcriptional regulator